jgi:hypothetical protein
MKSLFIIFLVAVGGAKVTVAKSSVVELYKRVEHPFVYSSDSLLSILKKEQVSTKNCYYMNYQSISKVLLITHSLDKALFFDKKGFLYRLPGNTSCENPVSTFKQGFSLDQYGVDSSINVETLLQYTTAISSKEFKPNCLSVVIFWNLTQGITSEENPFELEKLIKEKFNSQVNIIKINTDVNQNENKQSQSAFISFYEQYLSKINSAFIPTDQKPLRGIKIE